ncbi:Uncharacterised protein [Mycobacteroides abscessus subsp. abscessus]|nr:Uncharacterised protein [Mycobacteroides abscessus subsp. abscessus]
MPLLVGGLVSAAAGLVCATYLHRHPCPVVAGEVPEADDMVPPAPAVTPVCEPTPLARRS